MVDHEFRLYMKRMIKRNPDIGRLLDSYGVDVDRAEPWEIIGPIVAREQSLKQVYREKRADKIRLEKNEFQVKLEAAKAKALDNSIKELGYIIANNNTQQEERFNGLVAMIKDQYISFPKQLTETKEDKFMLPAHITYSDCWRKHNPSTEFPEGKKGPEHCILSYPAEDGIHWRCMIAYGSQNPDGEGFARTKYQVFHAELLRQGDCPRPLSRSITRRIPGVSWLFTKPDVCPLAGGEEHIIPYGMKKNE